MSWSVRDFLLFLAAGRLLVWLAQIAGILRPVWRLHSLLQELRDCDLCLGFWVYLGLGISLKPSPFRLWWGPVERVVLAAGASFLAHLIRLGWQSKFGTEVIDG